MSSNALPGVYDVLEIIWSISGEEKPELSATWMRYDVAPLMLPHLKVGGLPLTEVPFEGEDRLGDAGTGQVARVKRR